MLFISVLSFGRGIIRIMRETFTTKEKIRELAIVLVPIFITQISLFGMNFFDTIMSGQASSADLAGVAIGSSLWVPVFTGLNGILTSLVPIISQEIGANRKENIPFSVIQGIYLAVAISFSVIIVGSIAVKPILSYMSLDENVRYIAKGYLIALAYGIVPLFAGNVLRAFIDSLGYTRITMIIILIAMPINIVLNYVLIFGKFGVPALGGIGAGYATSITYWMIFFFTLFFVMKVKPFRDYAIFAKWFPLSLTKWKELLRLGLPIGFSIFLEAGIFSFVTLLMSQFDTVTIAAHQAAMNFTTLIYMFPLSVSMALTIVVGFEVGARRFRDAKLYARFGIGTAVFFSFVAAVILFFMREPIAYFYTNEKEVANLVMQFLLFAIFFQFSDAFFTPIQGVLRGYKDVNVSFIVVLVSYWLIGLSLGHIFSRYANLEAFGYWLGLIVGLAVGAAILTMRLIYVEKRACSNIGEKRDVFGET